MIKPATLVPSICGSVQPPYAGRAELVGIQRKSPSHSTDASRVLAYEKLGLIIADEGSEARHAVAVAAAFCVSYVTSGGAPRAARGRSRRHARQAPRQPLQRAKPFVVAEVAKRQTRPPERMV